MGPGKSWKEAGPTGITYSLLTTWQTKGIDSKLGTNCASKLDGDIFLRQIAALDQLRV